MYTGAGGGSRGNGVVREWWIGGGVKKTIRKDWGFDELVLDNFMNRDDDGCVAGKAGKNIRP
jgi:hypothetical protein